MISHAGSDIVSRDTISKLTSFDFPKVISKADQILFPSQIFANTGWLVSAEADQLAGGPVF